MRTRACGWENVKGEIVVIRLATEQDLLQATDVYNEILEYQEVHTDYCKWQRDLYPLHAHVKSAFEDGTLYVGEDEDGLIYGCVNVNHKQAQEYGKISWQMEAEGEEVFVIHTLGVRPSCAGKGYAKEFILFAEDLARQKGCKTLRLDTHEENIPAATLYQGMGYELRGKELFHFQNTLWQVLICLDKVL